MHLTLKGDHEVGHGFGLQHGVVADAVTETVSDERPEPQPVGVFQPEVLLEPVQVVAGSVGLVAEAGDGFVHNGSSSSSHGRDGTAFAGPLIGPKVAP